MRRLSALGEMVRRRDPDRYFCTLFAPAEHRETLFTLYAFDSELARARAVAREPFAALIRLQWWREVLEGARRRHEVAGPLGEALDAGALDAGELLRMVEGREMEAEAIETVAEFEAYVRGAAGSAMVAAARALGMEGAEQVRGWGAACGVAGALRQNAALRERRRRVLPEAVGRGELVRMAKVWLEEEVAVPTTARAAVLPTVLARRDLVREDGVRRWRDRVAVALAGLRANEKGAAAAAP